MTASNKPRSGPLPKIGWREWVRLPELDQQPLKAKIDTGARTSALHAERQELFQRRGRRWVRFQLHSEAREWCEALIVDERQVRNSGGHAEERVVIRTTLALGQQSWPIELTLTDRSLMGFRMLFGRIALRDRYLIDPGRSFIQSRDYQRQHRPH